MSLSSYDDLKLELADWIDRDDLDDQIDTFIDLAEARHKREIRSRATLTHDKAFSLPTGSRYINVPSDFLDIKFMRVQIIDQISGRAYYPDFEYVTINEMADLVTLDMYRPRNFTVHAQIELDAEPDQTYTAELFYYAKLTPLDSGNQTNSLLTDAPDAYLYGALAATAPFLMNDERVAVWENLYTGVRDALNLSENESMRPGPLVSKIQNIPHRHSR